MGLYDRVKELAEKKRISIRKVEEDLDFANGTLRQWNKSNPSVDRVLQVADYFHVSEAYLLGRVDNPEMLDWDSPISDEKKQTPEYFAIQRKAKNLKPEDQKRLLGMIDAAFGDIDNGKLNGHTDNDF